jgi:drug/metabolite transporter (DMT)-like permease
MTAGNTALGIALTAAAAAAQAAATILSRGYLREVPVGAFSVVRTGLGTVVFFCLALALYGGGHFAEAFTPFLWQWMLLYGTLIVVIGQTLWVIGIRRTRTADAALAEAFNPLGAVLAAYLILGEVPTSAQAVGGAFIALGIGLGLVATLQGPPVSMAEGEKAGSTMGFRGI